MKRLILACAAVLLPAFSVSVTVAATDGIYQLSEVSHIWDGTDAIFPATPTADHDALLGDTYDALQRLTHKSYPDSSTTFTYDSRNNILTAANSVVSYSFTYNAANRIKTVTDSRGYSVSYDYDANANRTKTTLQPDTPDQRIISYSYDDVNRLSTLTSPARMSLWRITAKRNNPYVTNPAL